jgi:hypothetical protein
MNFALPTQNGVCAASTDATSAGCVGREPFAPLPSQINGVRPEGDWECPNHLRHTPTPSASMATASTKNLDDSLTIAHTPVLATGHRKESDEPAPLGRRHVMHLFYKPTAKHSVQGDKSFPESTKEVPPNPCDATLPHTTALVEPPTVSTNHAASAKSLPHHAPTPHPHSSAHNADNWTQGKNTLGMLDGHAVTPSGPCSHEGKELSQRHIVRKRPDHDDSPIVRTAPQGGVKPHNRPGQSPHHSKNASNLIGRAVVSQKSLTTEERITPSQTPLDGSRGPGGRLRLENTTRVLRCMQCAKPFCLKAESCTNSMTSHHLQNCHTPAHPTHPCHPASHMHPRLDNVPTAASHRRSPKHVAESHA